MKFEDAVGIGFTFIAEEHIFTYLLSSPFTARNLVREKGDVEEVKKDLLLSLILSILLTIIFAAILKSKAVAAAGLLFGLLLYYVYAKRGELI
ncbi:MAG: hypothetical protein QXE51_03345 [Nitrososphaeria archaeon]